MIVLSLLPIALMLCSCTSTLSQLPAAAGGLPAGTPERPSGPAIYPAVYDIPPPRDDAVLTNAQQQQLQGDLQSARDRQVKRSESAAAKDAQ